MYFFFLIFYGSHRGCAVTQVRLFKIQRNVVQCQHSVFQFGRGTEQIQQIAGLPEAGNANDQQNHGRSGCHQHLVPVGFLRLLLCPPLLLNRWLRLTLRRILRLLLRILPILRLWLRLWLWLRPVLLCGIILTFRRIRWLVFRCCGCRCRGILPTLLQHPSAIPAECCIGIQGFPAFGTYERRRSRCCVQVCAALFAKGSAFLHRRTAFRAKRLHRHYFTAQSGAALRAKFRSGLVGAAAVGTDRSRLLTRYRRATVTAKLRAC